MTTLEYYVYGANDSAQKLSYEPSFAYDFTEGRDTRIIEVDNYDKTGTHNFSVVRITRPTYMECVAEFEGQLTDGIFENYRVGKYELVNVKDDLPVPVMLDLSKDEAAALFRSCNLDAENACYALFYASKLDYAKEIVIRSTEFDEPATIEEALASIEDDEDVIVTTYKGQEIVIEL